MINTIKSTLSNIIGKISWPTTKVLTEYDKQNIHNYLKNNYCIILSRRNGNLSTYMINLAHFALSRFKRFGYYSHALMNLEDEINDPNDFRLVEATGMGIHFSTFDDVFGHNCSSVALLKPKNITLDEWNDIMDAAKTYLGRPYDTLFDLSKDNALSCVELVRNALKNGVDDYESNFKHFESIINDAKNLDPHMFYICTDFEILYEIRH